MNPASPAAPNSNSGHSRSTAARSPVPAPPHMKLAVWVLTPNGMKWVQILRDYLPEMAVYCSSKLAKADETESPTDQPRRHPSSSYPREKKRRCLVFSSLSRSLSDAFNQYEGHLFIMSTGIVVRMIAPLITHKTIDPAVIVMDDRGLHVISLLSGHIGGANALATWIADRIDADPVITTATDVNDAPAIDVLASRHRLMIENPEAIKSVNMAFLIHRPIFFHDPHDVLFSGLERERPGPWQNIDLLPVPTSAEAHDRRAPRHDDAAYVFIDDVVSCDLPPETLILRPQTLVAGIGCNRGTSTEEIRTLLTQVLRDFGLAEKSLATLASISIKHDEPGLLELARELGLPLVFFEKDELKQAQGIQTPSKIVEKHIGVNSVCEAAAILAARQGKLIVPKHSTPNVTVAIARMAAGSMS